MKAALLFVIAPLALFGQIGIPFPGAGPYPGGPYPGGPYPGGGYPGSPYPGSYPGGGTQRPRSGGSQTSQPTLSESDTYRGVVRKLTGSTMELEIEDTRFLIIDFSNANPKPASLQTGDGLDVTATADSTGMFHASSIQPDRPVAAEINARDQIIAQPPPQQQEGRTGPPPTILVRPDARSSDADDGGPPVLKYGKPAQSHSDPIPDAGPSPQAVSEPVSRPALARSIGDSRTAGDPHMVLVEKARQVAANFLQGLPNYIVQESTTRYVSETRVPSWNALDLVTAEVVFEENHETYRNLKINGKASNKPPEDSGAWSTGEFGTILASLFAPFSDAQFHYSQDDTIENRRAAIFDFKVERVRSNWRIWTPGQYILPAYKGSVWIDKNTGEVLRLEMQASNIPKQFPEITVETAVDYDSIRLGTPASFLLPVDAQALSCWRDSNECQKNDIEFRNYQKFTGQTSIQYK